MKKCDQKAIYQITNDSGETNTSECHDVRLKLQNFMLFYSYYEIPKLLQ